MALRHEVLLRDVGPDEEEAVRRLTLRAYAEYAEVMEPGAWHGLARAVQSALEDPGEAARIVAERDGTLVGSVFLYPPAVAAYGALAARATSPELRLLAVLPEARGQGIGVLLVEECIRRARAMGARALGLHSSRSMSAALRMYLRLGFERVPELDFRPEGGELVEGYRLPLGDGR